MEKWGIVSLIAFLIALGLILRFGGSSNALAKTGFGGVSDWINALTLKGAAGNNP